MLPDDATLFLAAYAAGGCASVADALCESGFSSSRFAEWCNQPAFTCRLHLILASLEDAPPPDPFEFVPWPALTINLAALGINLPPIRIDPYGPHHAGKSYDHTSRCFAGVKASDLNPSDIEWFNRIISWKDVDRRVAEAVAARGIE